MTYSKDVDQFLECVLENSPLIYTAIIINITFTLIIFVIQLLIFKAYNVQKKTVTYIDECINCFENAVSYARFIRIPIAGVFIMGKVAGLKDEDVAHEYEKDSMERRALIYGLFGNNNIVQQFVDWPENQFLKHGYEGETKLLETAKKSLEISLRRKTREELAKKLGLGLRK